MNTIEFVGLLQDDWKLPDEAEIVIFGCGRIGKRVYQNMLEKKLTERLVCFCDNNAALRASAFFDRKVCTPDEAAAQFPDAAYIVANICVAEVTKQLTELGIRKIHILRG